jgi:uncharacterized membrane protein SpoIIM required for sporulation
MQEVKMPKLSHILFNPKKAQRHPFEIIILVFIYTSVSLFLSLWILPDHASISMVFLSVISCLYLVQSAFIREENKESDFTEESTLLKGHLKILWFLSLIFIGFLLAFTFWSIVLPQEIMTDTFSVQETTFTQIRALTGMAYSPGSAFSVILLNNLRVLLLSLILALFYGAGSVFILAWNASIIGFIIGSLVRNTLGLASIPYAFLKFALHGVPEILAYIAAALAGSILFVAVVRGDIKKGKAKRLFLDFIIITAISVALLVLAALLETYVSVHI